MTMNVNKVPDHLFFIVKEILTDKSEVFNVIFGQHKFTAVTLDDAQIPVDKFVEAINEHTCQTADRITTAP